MRVGITQLPVTLFTNPVAGEDRFDTAIYPLQFSLVPSLIHILGREDGESFTSANINGFSRMKATRIKAIRSSLRRKIRTNLDVVFVLLHAILRVPFPFLINKTKYQHAVCTRKFFSERLLGLTSGGSLTSVARFSMKAKLLSSYSFDGKKTDC